jgi:hypothetical protein
MNERTINVKVNVMILTEFGPNGRHNPALTEHFTNLIKRKTERINMMWLLPDC